MFSSLRSRLWLSYAFLIVTALVIVTLVLFLYLIQNPLSNRQTLERLRSVQTLLMERNGQPLSQMTERASQEFDLRIVLFSPDKQVIFDTYAGREASALPFPRRTLLNRNNPLVRAGDKVPWLFSLAQLRIKPG